MIHAQMLTLMIPDADTYHDKVKREKPKNEEQKILEIQNHAGCTQKINTMLEHVGWYFNLLGYL